MVGSLWKRGAGTRDRVYLSGVKQIGSERVPFFNGQSWYYG